MSKEEKRVHQMLRKQSSCAWKPKQSSYWGTEVTERTLLSKKWLTLSLLTEIIYYTQIFPLVCRQFLVCLSKCWHRRGMLGLKYFGFILWFVPNKSQQNFHVEETSLTKFMLSKWLLTLSPPFSYWKFWQVHFMYFL